MGNTISYQEQSHTLKLDSRGSIKGTQYTSKDGTHKASRYAGVPYALPPIDALRWRKPQPLSLDHVYSSIPPSAVSKGDNNTSQLYEPLSAEHFSPPCSQKIFSKAEATASHSGAYTEDCLRCNIWVPIATSTHPKPPNGWPVYIWLHGGWFQMGDPNQEPGMNPTELISADGGELRAIVVAVGYRLNVFGFLAGGEVEGNLGLWDQRCALEWIHREVHLFSGDNQRITLAGRSAGAYSVEAQLIHAFQLEDDAKNAGAEPPPRLFHRVFMCSNAIPAQPKTLPEVKEQYVELLTALSIPTSSPSDELATLREVSAEKLLSVIATMKHHTFRPITDNTFIRPNFISYLTSVSFANTFRAWNLKLLIGEVKNEETLYAMYNAPTEPTLQSLRVQVQNYYAPATTERILQHYKSRIPKTDDLEEWKRVFGEIIADGQVRAPSRLLVSALLSNGVPVTDIWRYQIAYRCSFIDESVAPQEMGVSHAMDKPLWNYAVLHGPGDEEKRLMKEWIGDLVQFVQAENESFEYGTQRKEEMKVIAADGKIDVQDDERWEELVEVGKVFCGL